MICLFEIIKTDQLIEPLCGSPMMILLRAFFHWIISHLHQTLVLETQPILPATWL